MNKADVAEQGSVNLRLEDPNAGRIIAKRAAQAAGFDQFTTIDWPGALSRFDPNFTYPQYYLKGYHGVSLTDRGYLSPVGAMSWDPIVRETFSYLEVPGFTQMEVTEMVLADASKKIKTPPRRVLDMGTGTGHAALAVAPHFPEAAIWGIDLAPAMLVVAEFKAKQAGLQDRVHFRQASAHQTGFESSSFDLITAWIMFHELPADFSRLVLLEMFRLCAPGGAVLIFDAFGPKSPRFVPFPEPYLKEFQQLDFSQELKLAGFKEVAQPALGWGHWYAFGRKP